MRRLVFHHRDKNRPSTEDAPEPPPPVREFARLGKKGVPLGYVVAAAPSAAAVGRTLVRVEVEFKDGTTIQFREELDNLYQPPAGSPEAQRLEEMRTAAHFKNASKIPKITLHLTYGETLPVRWDPDDPSKVAIDHAALHTSAVNEYIREQQPRQPKPGAVATGPPWEVPAHCPNCGAPVDQAKASNAPDPHCRFCDEPIPVTPRGRR